VLDPSDPYGNLPSLAKAKDNPDKVKKWMDETYNGAKHRNADFGKLVINRDVFKTTASSLIEAHNSLAGVILLRKLQQASRETHTTTVSDKESAAADTSSSKRSSNSREV